MDNFGVPKKVNRHVLKALRTLRGNGNGVPIPGLVNQVRYQMRDLVPVPNLAVVIQKSINNLSRIGLVEKVGNKCFDIACHGTMPSVDHRATSSRQERSHFETRNSRKRSYSKLNPNLKNITATHSNDSLSGDELQRTRKRLRSNNKGFNFKGSNVPLPKVRNFMMQIGNDFKGPHINRHDQLLSTTDIEQNFNLNTDHLEPPIAGSVSILYENPNTIHKTVENSSEEINSINLPETEKSNEPKENEIVTDAKNASALLSDSKNHVANNEAACCSKDGNNNKSSDNMYS